MKSVSVLTLLVLVALASPRAAADQGAAGKPKATSGKPSDKSTHGGKSKAGGKPTEVAKAEPSAKSRPEQPADASKGEEKRAGKQATSGRDDLDQVPARAAKALAAKALSNRKEAQKAEVKLLKKLRAVGGQNLGPGQVKPALRRLNAYRAQLKAIKKLELDALSLEASSLRLTIKAARIRELVNGAKSDLTGVNSRLAALSGGKPKAARAAHFSAVGLVIDALESYIKGDLAAAIIRTTQAIKADGKLALAHTYQGSFYYLTKNTNKAVESWEQALKLDPSDREVKQALRSIKGG